MKRGRNEPNESLQYLYNKYSACYSGEGGGLGEMIKQAMLLGENSCSLFEEYASASEPSLSADDLVRMFEDGLGDAYPSIRSLIEVETVRGFRRVIKLRTALTRDCVVPIISVQYILVWK